MVNDHQNRMAESLFDKPRDTVQARFEAYHAAHPEVWQLFVQYATQAKLRGMAKYSATSIIERIRWHHHVDQGNEAFKINNNYVSRYARKLVAEDPRFDGFFEMRELKAE